VADTVNCYQFIVGANAFISATLGLLH